MEKYNRREIFKMSLGACATLAAAGTLSFASEEQSIAASALSDSHLEKQFLNPPPGARPWVYWMWLGVDTTREAISKDLEEMHAKGIAGLILYDVGATSMFSETTKMVLDGNHYEVVPTQDYPGAYSTPIPGEPLNTWTPHWRELIRFASKEAGRLGINFCLSVGLSGTSGPIAPEYGQQKLVWSEISIAGPQSYDGILPAPTQSVPETNMPPKQANTTEPPRTEGSSKFIGEMIALLAVPDMERFDPSEVVNITANMDVEGHLRWNAPAGQWKIMRFGYMPTGKRNHWGHYTDGMSAEALDNTWNVTIGPLLKEMTPEERKGLMGVEDDSWEAGETTWTKLFPSEFQRLRYYDLIPWLPALADVEIGAPGEAEGVKRDYYRTIADLIAANHYARLRQLAQKNGLTCYSEAAGPNTAQIDTMLNCKGVDIAMAEFWAASTHRPTPGSRFLVRNAASANHIYGKPLTACESFTSLGPYWEVSFFDLKNVADQAFCDGCNLNVIHNYSHSPSLTAKPGYAYFAGTYYNRNVTWWEQTPTFNAYLGRCSHLLQQGLFVADALYYRGDDIGHGEPMKTEPALPAPGYDHDNCNLDVLLTRVNVKNGHLALPDGMSYRLLVLPDNSPMTPEALAKIAALAEAGATIVGPKPSGTVGLLLTSDEKPKFDALAERLWGNGASENKVGAGRVIASDAPGEVLRAIGIPPDFEYSGLSSGGDIDWIHRVLGDMEIYFIASRWDPKEKLTCTFRISGKQPEIWDPVTGEIRDAVAFHQEGGRTIVPLEFNPRGSLFIIFRRPISTHASGRASTNSPKITPQAEISGPWDVSFDPAWGGPAQITFDSLVDWTKRPEDNIRHYSGTAKYRKTFNLASLPPAGENLLLDLGEVNVVASVQLNGVDLGVVWTKPARVDITRAAHIGENELKVTVVNLWPNRLIADESLPPDKRLTLTNMHKFSAATPLYPSGLVGPVTLETAAPG